MLDIGKSRTIAEYWAALRGLHSLRCRDCQYRFQGRTMVPSDLKYARCPRCLRMDLNLWSERDFAPTRSMSALVRLGGRRYRCEYCRVNFVSFRRRKEVFTFRRWTKFGNSLV